LRPAWANSSQNPISKVARTKGTGSVAQEVALSSNPRAIKTKTKIKKIPNKNESASFNFSDR
jgi:hypothetical protein